MESGKEGMIYVRGNNIFTGYLDENIENPFEEISPHPNPSRGLPIGEPLPEGEGDKWYKT